MTNFERHIDWIRGNFENSDKILEKIFYIESQITEISDNAVNDDVIGRFLVPIRFLLIVILDKIYELDIEIQGINPDVLKEEFSEFKAYDKINYLNEIQAVNDVNIKSFLHNIRKVSNSIAHPENNIPSNVVQKPLNKNKIIQILNEFSLIFKWLSKSRAELKFNSDIYYKRNEENRKTIMKMKKKIALQEDRNIQINDESIVNILYNVQNKFKIPLYQRGYAWTKKELKTLFDDIERKGKSNDFHFFGNVSFIAIDSTIKVVDGQQRLTTILLLLKAIHNKYISLFNGDNTKIDLNLSNFINGKLPLERIDDQVSIDVLNKIWNNEVIKHSLERDVNVFTAYKLIEDWLKHKKLDEIDLILPVLTRFIVGINWIKDTDEFELFESLNSKGKKLSNYDIFKNYIYSLIDKDIESKNETEIARKFDSIIEQKFMLLSSNNKIQTAKETFMKIFIEYFTDKKVDSDNIFNPFKNAMIDWRKSHNKPIQNLSLMEFENLLLDISKFIIATLLTQTGDITVWKEMNKLSTIIDDVQFIISSPSYSSILLHYLFKTDNIIYDNKNGDIINVKDLNEISKIFRMFENWKVRRDIAFDMGNETIGAHIKQLNAKEIKNIDKDFFSNFREIILKQDGILKIPSIEKFIKKLINGEITTKVAAGNILYRIHRKFGGDKIINLYSYNIIEPVKSKRNEEWDKLIKKNQLNDFEVLNKIGNFLIYENIPKFKKYLKKDLTYLINISTNDNFSLNLKNEYNIDSIKELSNKNVSIDDFINNRSKVIASLVAEIFEI